jgi:hypothetical protein
VASVQLVSFLMALVALSVVCVQLVSSLHQDLVSALRVKPVNTRIPQTRLHVTPVLLASSLPVWAIRFVELVQLVSSLHR